MDTSSSTRSHPRRRLPPPIPQPPSTSFSASSSHHFRRRPLPPIRTGPFVSDDDRSWQADISWQEQSRGFQNRNLGSALSPWTATVSESSTNGSRIFKKSASQYYLSHTSGGPHTFTDPYYYEYSCSGYNDVPSGRLNLQSFVSNEQTTLPHSVSKQGRLVDYGKELNQYSHDDEIDVKCGDSYHIDHHSGESNVHQYVVESDEEKDEEEEEEVKAPKPVGLLSLFKYSSKLDLVLIVLGCIGALINGGSLPWYSYLFGKFVNKIALDTNTDQMMKDVQKVQGNNILAY